MGCTSLEGLRKDGLHFLGRVEERWVALPWKGRRKMGCTSLEGLRKDGLHFPGSVKALSKTHFLLTCCRIYLKFK
jgi:hypothetical protein